MVLIMNTNTQPTIAVSSCLLGNKVRYDGRHKLNNIIVDEVSKHFQLIAFCPECDIGLGVPRTPIELIKQNDIYRVIEKNRQAKDVTDLLINAANRFLKKNNGLNGIIFKSNSPSCGINHGIFATKIQQLCNSLPVVEEITLENREDREEFYSRVISYHAENQ